MKNKFIVFIVFAFTFTLGLKAQDGYGFLNKSKKQQRLKFKLINNLIVLPLTVNGRELSFILDSGVSRTILFNISQNDSLSLKNIEKVQLQGLGGGEPVDALISKKNSISTKNIINTNETIFVILKDYFDLSSKMGTTIHGIIGYNILKNFVVKINYKHKTITFYKTTNYNLKKCRKCEVFPLELHRKKPYIDVKVQLDTIGNKETNVKLLIDSGGSDAIWLFENTKNDIKTPNLFFKDILGEGLSGTIYGNRSRIPKIKIGSFEIEKPTVSFLDSISSKNARTFEERNGSIGAEILKRFIVWFDYKNKQIMLKKNGSFTKGFNYNMTGLEIVYNGKHLVKELEQKTVIDAYGNKSEKNNTINLVSNYAFKFEPSYRINSVLANSPGEKAGLLKDDIILRINNRPIYEFTLNQITAKLQEHDNMKIKFLVLRKGEKLKFEFRLEKKI